MKSLHGFSLSTIHEQAHLQALGYSLEQFMAAPIATLEAAGQADAVVIMQAGFRPLLPAQVALRRVLTAQWRQEGHQIETRRCRPVPAARRGRQDDLRAAMALAA